MKKIFYLSTCDTCRRILKGLRQDDTITLQDIKREHISPAELDKAADVMGSYTDLLNRRSRVYQSEGLKDQDLDEQEIRSWILKEYSMLKRPLAIIEEKVYAGNAKKTVAALKEEING